MEAMAALVAGGERVFAGESCLRVAAGEGDRAGVIDHGSIRSVLGDDGDISGIAGRDLGRRQDGEVVDGGGDDTVLERLESRARCRPAVPPGRPVPGVDGTGP